MELKLIAILLLMVSYNAYAKAEQSEFECFLVVYDSTGWIVDAIEGDGHMVENKNRINLSCHGYSAYADALFTNARRYESQCHVDGYGGFEMDNLNVSTPGGRVKFNCHKDKE